MNETKSEIQNKFKIRSFDKSHLKYPRNWSPGPVSVSVSESDAESDSDSDSASNSLSAPNSTLNSKTITTMSTPMNSVNFNSDTSKVNLLKWSEWTEMFKGHIDLEIGCGAGRHPLKYCELNPNRFLVAIERTSEKYSSFEKKQNLLKNNENLPNNLLSVHADAIPWVSLLAPDNYFENVFLLYPNPNPKNKSQRFIRMPFFSEILRVLQPGGLITMATNIPSYRNEFLEFGLKAWNLKEIQNICFSRENFSDFFPKFNNDARTHFEKKYLEQGQTCFQIQFQK